ncbi:MAG: RecX family transcriptional regulator [Ignavibacteria bacterium]|nr:RecX family transcriptional regulator [Ignavibacteria bacterium]
MRVTRIETQKRSPNRKNIYVDGEFVAGVSDETLLRLGLRTGDEIDPDKLASLQATEELLNAKRAALRFLSYRLRTVREVRDKLRENEFGDDVISKTVYDLEQSGLLNDKEFAQTYIRDTFAIRPSGKYLLKRRLLLLGLDKSLVDEALDESLENESQEIAALEAARKFIKKANALQRRKDPLKIRNRLVNFLSRRGFTWDMITKTVKEVLEEEHQENVE